MNGEAGARVNIELLPHEVELINKVYKYNKNIVLIVTSGRPLVLTNVIDKVKGLIVTFYLGMTTGEVLYEAISGKTTPSAKLTMSFPRNVGQLPMSYDSYPTGRPKEKTFEGDHYVSGYLDTPNSPLFPFGYGLSYNQYEYKNFKLDKEVITSLNDKIKVSIDVTNKGNYSSEEIVELYIEALYSSTCRPYNELKGFKRIHLEPKETKTVTFEVGYNELKAFNYKLQEIMENAKYLIKVGSSSINYQEKEIEVIIKE